MKRVEKSYAIDQCRLYKVTSPIDLAKRLYSTEDTLNQLARGSGNYKVWENKKGRTIEQPVEPLQILHARIHSLLSRIETPDYLHSAIKGRSYISNAKTHIEGGNLIKVDVKKFFQSVPKQNVYRFFRDKLKCADHAASLLADLLTINGHLPTGSSSSPIMSYYAFKDMFDEIQSLAERYELKMTCYVDDLTLSGSNATRKVLYEIRLIIAKHKLRSHKVRFFPNRRAKIVTGVVVHNGEVRLPNRRHLLLKEGFDALRAQETIVGKLDVLKRLMSRIYEAGQVDSTWLPRAQGLKAYRKMLKRSAEQPSMGNAVKPIDDHAETSIPF